jgi:peptide chain release factor subunit 3
MKWDRARKYKPPQAAKPAAAPAAAAAAAPAPLAAAPAAAAAPVVEGAAPAAEVVAPAAAEVKPAAAAAPAPAPAEASPAATDSGADTAASSGGGGAAAAPPVAAPAAPTTKAASTKYNDAAKTKAELDKVSAAAAVAAAAYAPKDTREPVNVIFIGHVDAGKSTIGGHLMFLTGGVDKRTLEKYEQEAKAANRESWYLSWALDTNEEERAKGKTVECGKAFFATEKKHYTIIDAPGHKSYVPSMIAGSVQADVACLVISSRKGEFEAGFDNGGQTREHAMLAKAAGVKTLVVVINKMDIDGWSEARFVEIVDQLTPFLKKTGFNPKDIQFIPISGQTGEGLISEVPKANCPWYSGPAFVPFLDSLPKNARDLDKPFRMSIADMYTEMGCFVMGKIIAGLLTKGTQLTLMPLERKVQVQQILLEDEEVDQVQSGDNVKLKLKNVEESDIYSGFTLCALGAPCAIATIFDAQVMIMEYKSIICSGFTCILHIGTAVEEIEFVGLICYIDKKTGKPDKVKGRPRFIKEGEVAIVRIKCSQPICMETNKVNPTMARFTLRDEGKTLARGNCVKIVEARSLSAAQQASAAAASHVDN